MTLFAILKNMRMLLNDPMQWTQGAYARDAAGITQWPLHPSAVCWCLNGALVKIAEFNIETLKVRDYLHSQATNSGYTCYIELNDSSTHSEILSFLDRALAEAKG